MLAIMTALLTLPRRLGPAITTGPTAPTGTRSCVHRQRSLPVPERSLADGPARPPRIASAMAPPRSGQEQRDRTPRRPSFVRRDLLSAPPPTATWSYGDATTRPGLRRWAPVAGSPCDTHDVAIVIFGEPAARPAAVGIRSCGPIPRARRPSVRLACRPRTRRPLAERAGSTSWAMASRAPEKRRPCEGPCKKNPGDAIPPRRRTRSSRRRLRQESGSPSFARTCRSICSSPLPRPSWAPTPRR